MKCTVHTFYAESPGEINTFDMEITTGESPKTLIEKALAQELENNSIPEQDASDMTVKTTNIIGRDGYTVVCAELQHAGPPSGYGINEEVVYIFVTGGE